MKDLFDGWRGFVKASSRTQLSDEKLLREFKQADKENLLANESDFSVSYEIELETNEPLDEGVNAESLQKRGIFTLKAFKERVLKYNFNDYVYYEVGIDDFYKMVELFFNHQDNLHFIEGPIQYEAIMLAIAYENDFQTRDFVDGFFASLRNNEQDTVTKAKKTIPLLFPKEFDEEASGQQIADWIEENLFNHSSETYGLENGELGKNIKPNLSGIVRFLRTGMFTIEGYMIPTNEPAVREFYDDFFSTDRVGDMQPIERGWMSKTLSQTIIKIITKNVEMVSQRDYETALEDPEEGLELLGYSEEEIEELSAEGILFLLREHLPNFMEKYEDILKFENDLSLENGIEFSINDQTRYLTGLNAAIEFLKVFFDDFNNQSTWFMDDNTGLHTNIGWRKMVKDIDRNLFKGLLLLNDDMANKGFENRKGAQWAKDIKKDALTLIKKKYAKKSDSVSSLVKSEDGFLILNRKLSSYVKDSISGKSIKSLGMNIYHLYEKDYIEFRYPGNVDPTYENMVNATLYYAHIVKGIHDENYMKKEYITKLIGFFNNLSDEILQTSKQDLLLVRKVIALPKGTVFLYPGKKGVIKNWILRYIATKFPRQNRENLMEARSAAKEIYDSMSGRFPIIYDGLVQKPGRPELKGIKRFSLKWVTPKLDKTKVANAGFGELRQSFRSMAKDITEFQLADPEIAASKLGVSIGEEDWAKEMVSKIEKHVEDHIDGKEQKDLEPLFDLHYAFATSESVHFNNFILWYKDTYKKQKKN